MAGAGAQNRMTMNPKTEAPSEKTPKESNAESNAESNEKVIEKQVWIAASPVAVWQVLTDPALVHRWLAEPQVAAQIQTTWQVGSPIVIRGVHHVPFEARGTVLVCDPPTRLCYSQISSLSRLPDVPESEAQIAFALRATDLATDLSADLSTDLSTDLATDGGTQLQLTIKRCATEAIYKHLEFYWGTTLRLIKAIAEEAKERSDRAMQS